MKKQMISVCAATVLAASMLAGGAVQAFAAPAQPADETAPAVISEENRVSDSWKRAADPTVTTKVRKLFDKAFDGLVGASYTPAAVLATRTTAKGTQYRVLCRMTVCYPGAQEQYVVVTLQRGLLGRAEILNVDDALCETDLVDDKEMTGGWQEAQSPAMTDEAKAAFEKGHRGPSVRGLRSRGPAEHPGGGGHQLPHPVRGDGGIPRRRDSLCCDDGL